MIDQKKTVEVAAGREAVVDFQLRLGTIHEQITVTASGAEQTPLEAFQAVAALDSLELATRTATSLGEVLADQPGVAKRSFGPGTARPVIRGFDGDRVVILQDGLPTGTVSSQSGDHGEPIDPAGVDRIEVVKGPDTLLYGGSALGGVINVITGHHQVHQHPHEGLRGYVTGNAGTGNGLGSGGAGFEYGVGKWLVVGDGGGQRSGDYRTPAGVVDNSGTRMSNAFGGFGRYGERRMFNVNYGWQEGRYGVPFVAHGGGEEDHAGHEHVDLSFRRHNLRFNAGQHHLRSVLDHYEVALNYSDWMHKELEGEAVGTQLFNRQFIWRARFEQRPYRGLEGRFGVSGSERRYKATGEERLAPPVRQRGWAVFALEEMKLAGARVQAGARVEDARYRPEGLPRRSFTGVSAAAGLHVPLMAGRALVVNYTHSFRPPALEELYNFGPHTGNLTYEIGNPLLKAERANGVDVSVRHRYQRVHGEVDFFYYRLKDFVYLAPTGRWQHGLMEARYQQAGSRYLGAEARLDVHLRPDLMLDVAADAVDAQLREPAMPLPRIPPARGHAGLEWTFRSFRVKPEMVLVNAQSQLFATESRTAGYALLNLSASYNWARQHAFHVISLNVTNAGDRLYRNHLSFIKDVAPEMGRAVRVTYTVRFF
jgi:iron complex outermembrane receptor protein